MCLTNVKHMAKYEKNSTFKISLIKCNVVKTGFYFEAAASGGVVAATLFLHHSM